MGKFKLLQVNLLTYKLLTRINFGTIANYNSENETDELLQLTLNAVMKSELHLHQHENFDPERCSGLK